MIKLGPVGPVDIFRQELQQQEIPDTYEALIGNT